MKVTITGGAGFIGLNLARRLLARGTIAGADGTPEDIEEIILFDGVHPAETPSGLDGRARFVTGDVADRDAVLDAVGDSGSVFHLASVVSAGGEKDFDGALRVNLEGTLNVFEAARASGHASGRAPRVVFASSVATFGSGAGPLVGDTTKQTPETTYGMTKAMGELLINDYTRKGFIDGRVARLATIIVRPGRPNPAASSFVSGVVREPLKGEECALPVPRHTRIAVMGHRACLAGFMALHDLDGRALGTDRALNLPNITVSVQQMIDATKRVGSARGIPLGHVTDQPDAAIAKIIADWPVEMKADRARALGLPADDGLEAIIEDYLDDFAAEPNR